jgi:hypothetical protein
MHKILMQHLFIYYKCHQGEFLFDFCLFKRYFWIILKIIDPPIQEKTEPSGGDKLSFRIRES